MGGCGKLSKAVPYLLVVALQCATAGLYLINDVFLKQGMSRYVLIVYRNAIAAITLAPFAFFIERKIRPKLTMSIFLKIMALAILEPILDMNLGYLGTKLTSATFTSAIMNATPAVTFALAVLLRLEAVKIKELRSQAKILGTLVTFSGALVITLYKGPIVNLIWSPKTSHFITAAAAATDSSHKNWIIGTICLLLSCVAWCGFCILQSITLKAYPAELSLVFFVAFIGTILSTAVTLVAEHRPGVWAVGFDSRLLAPLYSGIVCSGICFYVQGVVMRTKDAVFLTAFSPLGLIIVAILGSVVLDEKLHLGSVIGAIIILFGLYAVIWGKSKDHLHAVTSGKHIQLPVSMETAANEKMNESVTETIINDLDPLPIVHK